jgi:hypothetical protein
MVSGDDSTIPPTIPKRVARTQGGGPLPPVTLGTPIRPPLSLLYGSPGLSGAQPKSSRTQSKTIAEDGRVVCHLLDAADLGLRGWTLACAALSRRGEGQRGQELVPDGLWKIVEPLIPPQRERPQDVGPRYVDDRAVFTAIVYVLTSGLRLAASARRVRRVEGHRAPAVRGLDRGAAVAAAAPGGAGSARRTGGDRRVPRGGRCGHRAGQKDDMRRAPSARAHPRVPQL